MVQAALRLAPREDAASHAPGSRIERRRSADEVVYNAVITAARVLAGGVPPVPR